MLVERPLFSGGGIVLIMPSARENVDAPPPSHYRLLMVRPTPFQVNGEER